VCYFFRLVQDWLPMGGPGGRLHEQWVDLDYRAVRPWELRPCQPAVFFMANTASDAMRWCIRTIRRKKPDEVAGQSAKAINLQRAGARIKWRSV